MHVVINMSCLACLVLGDRACFVWRVSAGVCQLMLFGLCVLAFMFGRDYSGMGFSWQACVFRLSAWPTCLVD